MIVLLVLLVAAAITDLFFEKIPNGFILFGLAAGLAYRIWLLRDLNFLGLIVGILLPIFLFWPLFLIRAFGAGDLKLMAVMGIFFGIKENLCAIGVAIFVAGIAACIKLFIKGGGRERFGYLAEYMKMILLQRKLPSERNKYRTGDEEQSSRIHFAAALLVGGLVVMGERL